MELNSNLQKRIEIIIILYYQQKRKKNNNIINFNKNPKITN
jgi:hypothetical protein